MATKNKDRKYRRKMRITVPLGVVAGLAPTAFGAWDAYKTGGTTNELKFRAALEKIIGTWTGYSIIRKNWDPLNRINAGLLPFAFGVGIHLVAQRTGINRLIARTGLPILRI